MTWVIGLPGMPTGALGLADTRITVSNGHTVAHIDGIQKLHPIAPNLALAFAGSVELGFHVVDDLRAFLGGPPRGQLVLPHKTVWHWARRLRFLFSRYAITAPLELMVLAASPNEPTIPELEPSYGFVLRAPEFSMEKMPYWRTTAIGSGSDPALRVFVDAMDEMSRTWTESIPFEHLAPGWSGLPFLHGLSQLIKTQSPTPTVSHHLHLCMVRRHGTTFHSTDTSVVTGDKDSKMPWLARNLAEFQQLMRNHGYAASSANAAVSRDILVATGGRLQLPSATDAQRRRALGDPLAPGT